MYVGFRYATKIAAEMTRTITTGIDIPSGGQAIIRVTAALQNTAANTRGVSFANSASYTYDKVNGNSLTQAVGGMGSAAHTAGQQKEGSGRKTCFPHHRSPNRRGEP